MSNFEQDPFCYKGSEAEKADLAAEQAFREGQWDELMQDSKEAAVEVVKRAEMPAHPPVTKKVEGYGPTLKPF